MIWIYNLSVRIYILFIYLVSPFNRKAVLWIKGRKSVIQRIQKTAGQDPVPKIWVHCASLGEFEQGRPIIEKIKKIHPQKKIVLTFFSPSGYEIRQNYPKADYIFYLPADTKNHARDFIRWINPEAAIFIKYEFWYHYFHELHRKGIPLYSASSIFRSHQIFFRPYGGWYRKILGFVTHFFVQDEESEQLLKKYGFDHVTISGDTRFDRVNQVAMNAVNIPVAGSFKGGSFCLVAGSTWKEDEKYLVHFINESPSQIKYIIVPHEIHEENILRLKREIKRKTIRFSEAKVDTVKNYEVLLIDNIGMLSSLYRYAEVAYVGGGFGKGIHNILEPATFGIPVAFGPRYHKFKEARDLIREGAAVSFREYAELERFMRDIHENEPQRIKAGQKASAYVGQMKGATDRIMKIILKNHGEKTNDAF